jgi:thymidylate synthase (FAD)
MLKDGVAREVARSVLPVGTFTSFYATCNPRSLMHFLGLRTTSEFATFPSFPQEEIERVAMHMEAAFAEHFPLTWEAFLDNGRVAP